jgi:NDP-sugar pyrophosphorylase family protein
MSARIQAIILAGGKGTRLHPYTAVLPKPLMPLGDMPVLEHLLRHLRAEGIERVCLAVNHLRHLIQTFFGDGSALGMKVEYCVEDRPLGTAGPIAALLDRMADDFLVLNGDLVTDMSISGLIGRHSDGGADATVATMLREMSIEYGVLDTDPQGRVTGYREKPAHTYAIGMGVYVLRREALDGLVEPHQPLDMPQLLNRMIGAGLRVLSYQPACTWLDIGRPEDYARAQELIAQRPATVTPGVGSAF